MKDPIVIDPPGFEQGRAWKEFQDYVNGCGGVQYPDGEVNWRAAFVADPGCNSCPACGEYYWQWGRRQRCVVCGFEYETDWWPAYSEGCDCGLRLSGHRVCPSADYQERSLDYASRKKAARWDHPYFRFGFEHPVHDAWWHHDKIDWRYVLSHSGADMYSPSERVTKQLASTFRYHKPQGSQSIRYERIRDEAGKLANLIATNTPESREQSVALTKLEEVVMFANAAIARNETWDGNKMTAPLQLTFDSDVR